MRKENTATWTRGKDGGWQLLVVFARHWDAPGVGEGEGTVHTVPVYRKGDHRPSTEQVRLTSRVFRARDGQHKAFAELV